MPNNRLDSDKWQTRCEPGTQSHGTHAVSRAAERRKTHEPIQDRQPRHAAIRCVVRLTGTPTARVCIVAALAASLLLARPVAGPVEDRGHGRSDDGLAPAAVSIDGHVVAPGSRGARVRVRLLADMRFPAPRGVVAVPVGARLTARVQVRPKTRGALIRLQVRQGGWQPVATSSSKGGGTATLRVPTATVGRHVFRVLTQGGGTDRTAPFIVDVRAGTPPPQATPVAPVEVAPSGPQGPADAWTLLATGRPGVAFRWNPCTVIRYRTHLDGAPTAMAGDVTEAVDRLAAATGLDFLDMGSTTYSGTFTDPDQRLWPPDTDLLITVADEATVPALAGTTVGYARITRGSWTSTDARIDRAEVVLEKQFVDTSPTGFDTAQAGSAELLLHELGHAVGLGHTSVAGQVMFPTLGGGRTPEYQSGDLDGLARVGAKGGCLSTTG